MEMNNYLEDILKCISCPFSTIAVASPVGPSKHGLLTTFTATYANSLLWNRYQSNPIRKQLVNLLTDLPLLNKKAHLAWVVGIVAHRVQSWVRMLMTICPQWSVQFPALWRLASRKLPAKFQTDFSIFCDQSMWCLSVIGSYLFLAGNQEQWWWPSLFGGLEFPQLIVHCPSWCQH